MEDLRDNFHFIYNEAKSDQLRGPRLLRQEWSMDAIEALATGDQMLAD